MSNKEFFETVLFGIHVAMVIGMIVYAVYLNMKGG